MCIKYTDQQDPADTEWLERGTDKRVFISSENLNLNPSCLTFVISFILTDECKSDCFSVFTDGK